MTLLKIKLVVIFTIGIIISLERITEIPPVKYSSYNEQTMLNSNWWKHAVFYQVYPRSFMDSNNDGIGDLRGIIQKIDYFVDLGIDAFWLSPVYASPMVDLGYDVSDYRAIDPSFGTMDDFNELIQVAHENNLRVIMDFIPNHSSKEHEWFQKSMAGEEIYKDYYVWRKGRENNTKPPNNWKTTFPGLTWTYHPQRDQWYFHQYSSSQPEFDYRNSEVEKEMTEIMRFWLDHGIDGIRIDAAPSLYEHEHFPDEEVNPTSGCTPEDRCYYRKEMQRNRPQSFQVIYNWRKFLDEYWFAHGGSEPIMITESVGALYPLVRWYGSEDGKQPGAHFSFNFWFLENLNINSTTAEICRVTNKWLQLMDPGYISNWLLGNHDVHRLATRFGSVRSMPMIMFKMVLPGIAITYYGEEIGMENGEVNNDQRVDIRIPSRDCQRTPFQWNGAMNAGFNAGNSTWLPVGRKYVECNVARQKRESRSHLNIYKKMVALRKSIIFRNGTTEINALSETIIQVVREYKYRGKLFLMNIGAKNQMVHLDKKFPLFLTVDLGSRTSNYIERQTVKSTEIILQPFEAVIFDYQHV